MILPVLLALGTAEAADADKGKATYTANCMACHGAKADGNGPAAMALDPKPSDFTKKAFWDGTNKGELKKVIKTGKPGTPMAPFPQLSDADVANLIAYLETFKPAEE